jgi:hypothetical protein
VRDGIKKRLWPTLIVTALLGNVILGIFLVRVANSDPSFAVEPDYYRKAVGWDSVRQQAEINRELGWIATAHLPAVQPGEPEAIEIELTDDSGRPITNATVNIEAMPVAFANRVNSGRLNVTSDPGRYSGNVVVDLTGLWEFRLVATRDDVRFTHTIRLEVFSDSAAQLVTVAPGDADIERLEAGMRATP